VAARTAPGKFDIPSSLPRLLRATISPRQPTRGSGGSSGIAAAPKAAAAGEAELKACLLLMTHWDNRLGMNGSQHPLCCAMLAYQTHLNLPSMRSTQ